MKPLKEIKKILAKHKSELRQRYKVSKIGVFGSYIHGAEDMASDIDILVEFYEPIGWEFVDLKEFLEDILGNKVDLVTALALKPKYKDKVLKEVVYA